MRKLRFKKFGDLRKLGQEDYSPKPAHAKLAQDPI
jgi:hypothetical protein